jgi:predicted Zn-dependent protease with MMP-like domain
MAWHDIRNLPTDWSDVKAPSLADLSKLANAAMTKLPDPFRSAVEGIIIQVDDFPDDNIIDEMELETPFDLLGLYRGVELTGRDSAALIADFDRILLYRRAILDYWAETDDSLGDLITHILLHEIGRHLGMTDDEVHDLEDAADDRGF